MKYTLLLSLFLLAQFSNAQSLKRRADIGASFSSPQYGIPGAQVRSVRAGSALQKAGLKEGDVIIKLNGELIDDPDRWSDIRYALHEGQEVTLLVKRGQAFHTLQTSMEALSREQYKNTEVEYGEVVSDYGLTLRTITTYPKKRSGNLPAIFLISGLSCSSIEVFPGRPESGWTQVLSDIASKSNMVFMRVEKPGVGDSEGACGEGDFHGDIAGYRAALKKLKTLDMVDTTRIVIYGSSMGSALAPIMANEIPVAGVISDGTFVKTWFEHMLEIERRIRAFQGDSPSETMRKMNHAYIPLYHGMLIEKKSYAEVIEEKPYLAEYNYHSPAHMYGRPVAYYHQVQDTDFAKAWEEIKVPVRILRGTNDWIMSAEDNYMIMDILDQAGHKDHVLYEYPGLDHWNKIHEKPIDSFQGKPGKWEDKISQIVIDWAWEIVNKSERP
ncbi:MAG: alpha/beta fold hydrolase [Bacteroidota bacterium]